MSIENQVWHRGETYGRRITIEDDSGNKVDPASLTITIQKPNGETEATLSLDDLEKVSTGVYKMKWKIPEDAAAGLWTFAVKATLNTGEVGIEEFYLAL